jgi:hypothetical protein
MINANNLYTDPSTRILLVNLTQCSHILAYTTLGIGDRLLISLNFLFKFSNFYNKIWKQYIKDYWHWSSLSTIYQLKQQWEAANRQKTDNEIANRKSTNNDLQNTTRKTKHWTKWNPVKIMYELRWSGRVTNQYTNRKLSYTEIDYNTRLYFVLCHSMITQVLWYCIFTCYFN